MADYKEPNLANFTADEIRLALFDVLKALYLRSVGWSATLRGSADVTVKEIDECLTARGFRPTPVVRTISVVKLSDLTSVAEAYEVVTSLPIPAKTIIHKPQFVELCTEYFEAGLARVTASRCWRGDLFDQASYIELA